ncbi:MAG: hypothetical protein V2A73_13090 [Pseudomonadota bacterium]
MPCWEVRTMSVEFKAKHHKLLKQAIEALGWTYESTAEGLKVKGSSWGTFTVDLASQKAEINSSQQSMLNRLKQQYSKEVLKQAAKLRGWQFKQQGQEMKGVLRR